MAINIETIITTIQQQFSDENIAERFDLEVFEWLDSDWEEDGCENAYEWYASYGNGEAEDVVIREMIDWYKDEKNKGKEFCIDDYCLIDDEIRRRYSCF